MLPSGGKRGETLLEIIIITKPFMLNVSVNCYLANAGNGFVLIDTGRPNRRGEIEAEMEGAGCGHGSLKLIILTHGDFDHSGNAAYFARKFGVKIAMHGDDSGMLEHGDMLWNRARRNPLSRAAFGLMFRLGKEDMAKPDLCIAEGYDFTGYGFDAKAVELPGHSRGSVGILTGSGDLFCGDLLANLGKPDLWSIIDDKDAARESVERLKSLPIKTVYPGHGKPFPIEEFLKGR